MFKMSCIIEVKNWGSILLTYFMCVCVGNKNQAFHVEGQRTHTHEEEGKKKN